MRTKSEPFTLCMLGTDTNYTPELKQEKKSSSQTAAVADYPKGETLSIISSLIKSNEVKIDLQSSVPYKSDAVTVITGPDTLGRNVGEKIGLGLAEILLAIARGKQPINIIAHSRGAVESVLIAHELQAVCNRINNCDSIDDLVGHLKEQQTTRYKSKPINNTPDIIDSLRKQLNVIPQQQHQQWFKSLQGNISATSVNFFGIDPVPGDALGITWYDERYFTLPAIVKNSQILYYENERSDWGFTPAYVEAEDPEIQQLKHDSIPGHHGTGSAGNNASQQKKVLDGRTTHVQKLMIFKLLDFLNQNGVRFIDLGESLFNKYASLGAKYIKRYAKVNEQSFDVSEFDFPAIYRELYQKIVEHRADYNRYNKTHYQFMGIVEQRRLLKKGHDYGLFTDAFTLLEGLINAEHGCLIREELCKVFGLKDDITDLSQFVKQIHANLATQLNTLVKLPSQKSTDLMSSGVMVLDSAEIERQKLEEKTQVEVINIFELAVKSVSSSYLKYDWSSADKQQEKKLLFAEIKELFKLFETLATPSNDDEDVKGFVAKLTEQSIGGIHAVIKQQYDDLNSNFSQLQQSKNSKIAQYFKSLAMRFSTDIRAEIDGILAHSDYQLIAEYPIKRKIAFIVAELRKFVPGKGLVQLIESDFAKNNPPREEQSLSLNNPLDISAELTHAFIEQHEQNFEQFARLYEQMDVFIKDIGGLMALLPEHKKIYGKYIEKLSDQLKQLVQMAASTFYEHHKLADVPAVVEGAFAVKVREYAIEHYDGLAEQYQLAEEIQRLQGAIDALSSEKDKTQSEHQQQVEDLKTTNQSQITALDEKHREMQDEIQQLQNQNQQLEQQYKQALDKEQKAYNEQQNQCATEHTMLLALLHNKHEAECLLLIEYKLRPLTRDYLQHLQKSSYNCDKAMIKIGHVEDLLTALDDTVKTIKASERVDNFYLALDKAAGDLQQHRDPGWKLFVRNAVICGAILASGIIPGLLFLAAYTKVTGNSYSFWSSQGTHYLHTANGLARPEHRNGGREPEKVDDEPTGLNLP